METGAHYQDLNNNNKIEVLSYLFYNTNYLSIPNKNIIAGRNKSEISSSTRRGLTFSEDHLSWECSAYLLAMYSSFSGREMLQSWVRLSNIHQNILKSHLCFQFSPADTRESLTLTWLCWWVWDQSFPVNPLTPVSPASPPGWRPQSPAAEPRRWRTGTTWPF